MGSLKIDPWLRCVRSDPRYAAPLNDEPPRLRLVSSQYLAGEEPDTGMSPGKFLRLGSQWGKIAAVRLVVF